MSFNGTEGAVISTNSAATLTANYRNSNPNGVKGVFFGREILQSILDQTGCKGIRFYFAMDANGNNTLVAVGADASENDQMDGVIADFSSPCPPHCSSSNSLNG